MAVGKRGFELVARGRGCVEETAIVLAGECRVGCDIRRGEGRRCGGVEWSRGIVRMLGCRVRVLGC